MTGTIFAIILFLFTAYSEQQDSRSQMAKENFVYKILSIAGVLVFAYLASIQIEELIKMIIKLNHQL